VRKAKKAGSKAGLVGVRVRVVLAYGIFTALALLAFSVCPTQPAIQWASIAAVGFGLYGPQMLIGLCGAEV
jgi:MFS transporter, OPA family, sugar phosphate sensor protein UhpC